MYGIFVVNLPIFAIQINKFNQMQVSIPHIDGMGNRFIIRGLADISSTAQKTGKLPAEILQHIMIWRYESRGCLDSPLHYTTPTTPRDQFNSNIQNHPKSTVRMEHQANILWRRCVGGFKYLLTYPPGFTNIAGWKSGKSPSWIGNTSTQMVDFPACYVRLPECRCLDV